jgi:hypothetical protein
MLGEELSFDRIPYFFSDQYDVGMEYSGHAPQSDQVVFRVIRPRASSSPSGCATGAWPPG